MSATWVKYKDNGGPLFTGEKGQSGKYLYPYNPPKPWGVWSQILGVIAECEGRYDTVVMYDGTGVTFGAFQWTFTSGRLQLFLEFLRSIPIYSFECDSSNDSTVFENALEKEGRQLLDEFGFSIEDGALVCNGRRCDPRKDTDRSIIVEACIGKGRDFALRLCRLFANVGRIEDVQFAQNEYAKLEIKKALHVKRGVLHDIGGTIARLLPEESWGTPIPAIFFNLWWNSPGHAYCFFSEAMRSAEKKAIVSFDRQRGFHSVLSLDHLLEIIWDKLCITCRANWGFRSKRYLANQNQLPRVTRIRPAVEKYYGKILPLKEDYYA